MSSSEFLSTAVTRAPSNAVLQQLAGHKAAAASDSRCAALFLRAAAKHLTTEGANVDKHIPKYVEEVMEAIGKAVTNCQPRSAISQSGILPVVAALLPTKLSCFHVEFLQASIFASQYSYADRIIADSWPLPSSSVSVTQVLRYYYLRGVVHMACEKRAEAIRSFRTCLSIPSEVVSAIAVAAWKKMILVQSLEHAHVQDKSPLPLQLPASVPSCLHRYLSQGKASKSSESSIVAAAQEIHVVDAAMADVMEPAAGSSSERSSHPFLGTLVYRDFVRAFWDGDRVALTEVMTANENVFKQDGNLGLVRQVLQALSKRQVCLSSRIFTAMPAQELAATCGLELSQLPQLLLQVSLEHTWAIQVNGDFVRFPPMPDAHTTNTTKVLQLAAMLQDLNVTAATSAKYASVLKRESESKSSTSASASAAGPRGVEDI